MNTTLAGPTRPRQRDRLLALLEARENLWVPLPDILSLGIAQYGARILDLRRLGHRIESKQEGDRSWFRLVTALASTAIPEPQPIQEAQANPEKTTCGAASADDSRLFSDDAPLPHLDLG